MFTIKKATTSAGIKSGILIKEPRVFLPNAFFLRKSAIGYANRSVPNELPIPTFSENRNESLNSCSKIIFQCSSVNLDSPISANRPRLCSIVRTKCRRKKKQNKACAWNKKQKCI